MIKQLVFLTATLSIFSSAQSQETKVTEKVFDSDLTTEKTPWTHLDFANDPDDFQFAIVTDRTGGAREGIFEDAVKKINWLSPEFVMSVGDLIQGKSGHDSVELQRQWAEHFERIEPLKMPFFHLAGNHDIRANNDWQIAYWNDMFGAAYYSFTYKGVLFLCLFSNQGMQVLSKEQVAYFKEVLEKNQNVKWTMVFLHHPLWKYPHMTNFSKIEEYLKDRKHTVFAGHTHQYEHKVKNETNYYVLASTGGGSPLLGNSSGYFDHFTWVTMSDQGPIVANLRLDGILPDDVANEESLRLTSDLIESVNVNAEVLVDSKTAFRSGKAYMTFKNVSDLPLHFNGRFFHSHHVVATPSEIAEKVPPNSTKVVEVSLESIQPFDLGENILLEYQGTIGYQHEVYQDLELSGSISIPIQNSTYQLLQTKEVDFTGSYEVVMEPAFPGTMIRYSLDGTEPNLSSSVYTAPFEIEKTCTVNARIFSKDGSMKSEVVSMRAKTLKPGNGVVVEHYDYSLADRTLYSIPDFSQFAPEKITIAKSLHPQTVAGKEKRFGLVYKGNLSLKESGTYLFSALSDDALRIFIDGIEVISDPIKHGVRPASGRVQLKKGKHRVEIHYLQWGNKSVLEVEYTTPSGAVKELTGDMFSFDENTFKP